MTKKSIILISTLLTLNLTLLTLGGCVEIKKNSDNTDDKKVVDSEKSLDNKDSSKLTSTKWNGNTSKKGFMVGERYNPEKIVKEAVRQDDNYIDFKIQRTDAYLTKLYTIMDQLDNKFEYDSEPEVLVPVKSQYQFNVTMTQNPITKKEDLSKFTKDNIIEELSCDLIFEDGEKKVSFEDYSITLVDPNKLGEIKLTNQAKEVLRTIYPNIDMELLQNCIDSEYKGGLEDNYETLRYDAKDKYTKVYLHHYFNDKYNSRDVSISIQTYVDYPVK